MRGAVAWVAGLLAAGLWLGGAVVGFAQTTGEEASEDDEEAELAETTSKETASKKPATEETAWKSEAALAAASSETKAADRFLFFTGMDLWRNGGFAHGGFVWAHQGLSEDGFVFKLLLNGGAYRYLSGTTQIVGRQLMAAALPGWRFRRDGFELTVFGGLDVQQHDFVPDDPNRLRGTHFGARGGFDVWYEPFQNVMLNGSASFSTVGLSYWTRAAAGYRFFDSLWFGPEFLACGDNTYRQLRVGAHITSLRLSDYELSIGAGWVTDTDGRDGVYGRLGVLVRWDGVMFRSIDSH